MHQCSRYNSIVLHKKHTASIVMGIPKEHQQQKNKTNMNVLFPLNTWYIIMIPMLFWLKDKEVIEDSSYLMKNKTLGRAQDPRANGAWLSKVTE